MSATGQNAKYSLRADIFRCCPDNRHAVMPRHDCLVPTADMVVLFRHLENRGVRPVVQSKFGYRWPAVHPFTCAGVKIGFD
jgi:hypothetical protein